MPHKPSHFDDLLQNEESFSDPYQVIAAFFDLCGVSRHREKIISWMETVNKEDYWRDSSPSELLFYYKKLITLIKAVHQIYKKNKARKTATDLLREKGYNLKTNLLHPALYFGWGRNTTIWEHFPRYLTLDEYNDPYLVFPQFFGFHSPDEWHQELSELLSDALSKENPAEVFTEERNMLLIQKNLLKLVEAVHLIDVREVKYNGNYKKKYSFTLNTACDDLQVSQILSLTLKKEDKSKVSKEESDEEEDEDEYDEDEYEDEDDECEEDEDDEEYEEDDYDEEDDDENYNSNRKEKVNEDILAEALKGRAKNIRIIIRGSYVVNHLPSKSEGNG